MSRHLSVVAGFIFLPDMRVFVRSVFIGVIVAMKCIFVALSRSPASSAIESHGIECAIGASREYIRNQGVQHPGEDCHGFRFTVQIDQVPQAQIQ